MHIKWLIAIIASMIFALYFFLPRKRKVSDGYNIPMDIIGKKVGTFIMYLLFWVIWLIVFK